MARARRLRRVMTLPEVQLWAALRGEALGARVRRQHPVGPFVLDFFVTSAKLAIEIDGAAHDVASIAVRDLVRNAWLAARGIRVLRINAADVLDPQRRIEVLDTIAAALSRNLVHPPPQSGGGEPPEAVPDGEIEMGK